MKKLGIQDWGVIVLAVMVAMAVFYVLVRPPVEEPVARNVNAPKTPYTACYHETGNIVTDTAYLLVDLSNTTDWPHTATNEIILKSVAVQGTVGGAHASWYLNVGVVVENDATNGTAAWIDSQIAISGTFSPPQRTFAEGGLNLRTASDTLVYGVTNSTNDRTLWQNDVGITATVGTTGTVGVGDLVILADEISDGATFDFSVCVDYDTE